MGGAQLISDRAYPIASLGHAAWILRHFSYRAVFIWGLSLYGLGALLAIPAIIKHSFPGFCVCIFIIGNGLGSLETAANPYIAGSFPSSHFTRAASLMTLNSQSAAPQDTPKSA